MNPKFAKFMIAGAIGLGVAVIVLFNKNWALDERLAKQQRLFENEGKAKTAELVEVKQTIARLGGVLAQNTSDYQARERTLSGEVDALKQGLTNAGIENRNRFSKVDAALAKVDEHQRNSLASLKDDVAKGVEATLTKQVVAQASETVVKGILDDKSLIKDEAFLNAVAKLLVDHFRDRLRGASGADADNEKVAALLKKDPEFLDLVSTTALILKDEKTTEKSK